MLESMDLEALQAQGDLLLRERRLDEALDCFRKIVEQDPENFRGWVAHGAALRTLGRHSDALASFERALRIDPRSTFALSSKARALASMGRSNEAIQAYEAALKIDPRWQASWLGIAEIEEAQGNLVDLFITLQSARLNLPASTVFSHRVEELRPKLNSKTAWTERGLVMIEQGRFERAVLLLEEAIRIDPQNAVAWSYRGKGLHHLGRPEEALASLDQALSLNPDDPQAWIHKAACLGDSLDALRCYDRAARLAPDRNDVWFDRAQVEFNLGHKEDAKRSLERFLQRAEGTLAAQARSLLQALAS